MGKLAMLMKYRLPVKVNIVKHTGSRLRAWEIPGTASSRYQLALRLLPKLGDGWLCRQQSNAGGRGLREAFNHPGPSVVQAVVDLTRIIHDSSSRNRAVAKQAVPDERPAPVHVNREGASYWIHGLDLSDYPASHGWIPLDKSMQIERCLETLRVGVGG